MKTLDKIPTGKIKRTGKLLKTGAKVGKNYLSYYGHKILKNEADAKEKLNQKNAEDVYDSLKELKGSALKVAQMLSMEKNIMPDAFVDKFSLSQFSVPPLSGALVRKTFRKSFRKNPEELFDAFAAKAQNAASIGQVHKALKGDQELAVKIQYPGVRDSISSDLKMVKPVALRMFNIQKEGSEQYFQEVENKLLEETDYELELKRSREFVKECRILPNMRFPHYYPEYSSDRIITMDWMNGIHFSEFIKSHPNQKARNQIGQSLWDFYMYQLYILRKLHADPHPGNFLINSQNELIVIDFGCIKILPPSFYEPYLELTKKGVLEDNARLEEKLKELEFLKSDDSSKEHRFFIELLQEILSLLTRPLRSEAFDFSDNQFFDQIAALGERYANLRKIRRIDINRGSKHFIYVNRTLFGLYNMMHDLHAKDIRIENYKKFDK